MSDTIYQLKKVQQVKILDENATHYLIQIVNGRSTSASEPWWITKPMFRNKYKEVGHDQ